MVNHHMDVAETVQDEVRGKLYRDNSCSRLDELLYQTSHQGFSRSVGYIEVLELVQCLF